MKETICGMAIFFAFSSMASTIEHPNCYISEQNVQEQVPSIEPYSPSGSFVESLKSKGYILIDASTDLSRNMDIELNISISHEENIDQSGNLASCVYELDMTDTALPWVSETSVNIAPTVAMATTCEEAARKLESQIPDCKVSH